MSKQLTIEQLKALEVGDWVWVNSMAVQNQNKRSRIHNVEVDE